jgi:Ca2+-binding EF-hand superfamily protein
LIESSCTEVGKGYITAYDIEKMAIAHDFTWTDGEIAKMVHSLDSDGDRKV